MNSLSYPDPISDIYILPLWSNNLRKLCSQTAWWSSFFSMPLCIFVYFRVKFSIFTFVFFLIHVCCCRLRWIETSVCLLVIQHADLEEKNDRLQQLTEEQERSRQLQLVAQEKIKKDVEMVKKQLQHERNLKRDAFQRVEELQTEVIMCLALFLVVAANIFT